MTFYAFSALVNAITSIILGGFVFLRAKNSRVRISFTLFASSVGLWSVWYYFWQLASSESDALLFSRILMFFASFIPATYLHFVLALVNKLRVKQIILVCSYIYFSVFALLSFSPHMVSHVEPVAGFAFWPIAGPLYAAGLFVWLLTVIYTTSLLVQAYHSSSGLLRSQVRYMLLGMVLGFSGGITNYFLWYRIPIPPIGNILVSVYVILTAYAIVRYKLLNIKIIATQVLVFAIIITLMVRVISADSVRAALPDIILFILMLIFGILLIRSVSKEVAGRERVEQLAKQLTRANKKLKLLDSAKTEFLSIAAHQIRTPLTGIKGYLDMILKGDMGDVGNAVVKDRLQDVFMQADRLSRLVTVFLNVSRIEAGKLQMKYQLNTIQEIIESVMIELRPEAKRRNLNLRFVPATAVIPALYIDKDKMHDVVMNVIDNALKYTQKGSVTITLKPEPHAVQCVVEDTGMGIDAETIVKLFQKFSRGEKGLTTNTTGSGIGLYIARKIIEMHGGRIWAESNGIGQGARFIFTLPLSLQANPPVEVVAVADGTVNPPRRIAKRSQTG
ncbi:MAG: hypothetical protein A3H59_03950 [Candidatus Jacksonbacteria bacterium RIFCSPLOWO2_02_FULL_43_9]|nr:MAG: hypothetical protein UV70_C0006G0020 [Parcubacteria group bacterium GW2011_GWA2_43_13]OGY69022.1 MAG: hypothetical protein A3B94_00230 [Candidatus Jacksonbacteria bacterium RIFCSPHIGHO2_02_FULL_43_10]OGY70285.1 MAG: hypothetical protein A2986_04450 [Candidatus Jacksonbacteria bacterium RIFCSPLOWO2_01_FULL_44_13]OGY72755.1 MAG: hypothetical protein A3H59_03950 [Candidatus Jacksonbacteria bacterium RIFCSPLOWO2_02_FULL_43_9]HAZ16945.1 hypothetical protein [Candidatus Jacksonbacteria bacter